MAQTAGELIALLQKLPPETPVYVDIGEHDWGSSHAIELNETKPGQYPENKVGAYHLTGIEDYEYERMKGI